MSVPRSARISAPARNWAAFLCGVLAVALFTLLLMTAGARASGSATASPEGSSSAALCVVKKQDPWTGRIVPVYKTKTVKLKVNGKTVRKKAFVYKTVTKTVKVKGKSVKRKVRVKVPKRAACVKTKLCVVKAKNSKGKSITVYLTRVVKRKVRRRGKLVTVRKRVFVYKKVGRKKVKVPKYGSCKKQSSTTNKGVPVAINVRDPSAATVDFGAFKRDFPLEGQLKGFIVGKGFFLGQDNQIELTSGRISLGPSGVFIDDACDGQVTDSIRTDPQTFTEIDPTSVGNTVNVTADSKVTGRVKMRVQVALDMRNDDNGCNAPYITTGWSDFTVTLFFKGTLGAGGGGLQTKVTIGETVLGDLSACLAPGDPNLPCDGFIIPFPGILTATIVGQVKVG